MVVNYVNTGTVTQENKTSVCMGKVCVTSVGILFLATYYFRENNHVLTVLASVFLGGFIGGFTNSVAITMLFRKYWFFPGSGVLLKKRDEIIQSLANTVEKHIINPEILETRLKKKIGNIDNENVINVLNAINEELKKELLKYINDEDTHAKLVDLIEEKFGVAGKFINISGIKDYDVLAHEILDNLDSWADKFAVAEPLIQAAKENLGTWEEFLFTPNNQVVNKYFDTDESLFIVIMNQVDIHQIVVENLSRYPPEKIRDIIETSIKNHLGWLEVFGVFLGMGFSFLFQVF